MAGNFKGRYLNSTFRNFNFVYVVMAQARLAPSAYVIYQKQWNAATELT